ncbi:MAG: Glu/Leu/Phe/Val dehydrogenase [Gammaproteobacteria bacterium]|nr:Glu/Leu/Phe/Val dehydrogenase [Gammaproteobacteria bacterium]MDH3537399.1 Glu/Leu/Phe/Val dehydrogenase [Gammaproteobacteria bacterium]
MNDIFELADDLGPLKVIHVHEPGIGLKGVLVVDNVARGPSIGGVRMAPDATAGECARLARAMTFKNAAADLPHGGGKAVLVGDPKMPKARKETLIRGFCCALREVEQYIFGPDMGTDEECMAWVKDEIGRAVGLPRELGGIPLDEIGATGFGLSHAVDIAQEFCEFETRGARFVVQGFGAVGKHAARFLGQSGAVAVAVSDSRGTLYNPDGLDIEALIELKSAGKSVTEFAHGEKRDGDTIIDIECDIWIPAARPDVIHEGNVDRLKTRLIAQGANIPVTYAAEKILHQRGILNIPDFIANAGGVICAAIEYQGSGEAAALASIEDKLRRNTREVLETARREQILPRDAALAMARSRVEQAMSYRRWHIF